MILEINDILKFSYENFHKPEICGSFGEENKFKFILTFPNCPDAGRSKIILKFHAHRIS